MQIFDHPLDGGRSPPPCVAALGNFDGFHRGHQVVVGEAGRVARAEGLSLAVVTTEPHPRTFFRPGQPAFRLTTRYERLRCFDVFGVEMVHLLPFDDELAATTGRLFAAEHIAKYLNVRFAVAGFDYHFGKGRDSSVQDLIGYGSQFGFDVTIVPPVKFDFPGASEEVYSSTSIRNALREGSPRRAADLLGRWWTVSATVEQGARRGHTIGFPTANVRMGDALLPKLGVYAVRARVPSLGATIACPAVANLGRRPSFGGDSILLEVHLFDVNPDIYGERIIVEFVEFIREERKFDGLKPLRSQIERDCREARRILAAPENERHLYLPETLDDYLQSNPVKA